MFRETSSISLAHQNLLQNYFEFRTLDDILHHQRCLLNNIINADKNNTMVMLANNHLEAIEEPKY